ncbi:serine hydrolase domain-containing protein [Sphingomonas colocasiae]|uniref:Beta-lactamase family protein n=1 Tax=Sphingomonas colocasiae TaxID=1848973 RepID=A0ABS7PYG1_9SPHN|nr:serine hydrolase domain-containing protein [Sphingomonas colocasiae]MBY8826233.1 beta-lactamase family protein [Sphingomonas colocasiae]
MRGSRKYWLALTPALLLLAHAMPAPASAGAAAASATAIDGKAIDRVLAGELAKGKLAGAVVGILQNGRVTLVKGYGMADLEDGQPVKPDTIFRIGSVTKQFTAAMLLLLVERGQVSLSDPISKYFPDFPKAEGITVRHLLNHTSGIHSYTDQAFWEAKSPLGVRMWRAHTMPELVTGIAAQDNLTDFPVGTDYRYNNSAYVMAGALVEKLTGKPYALALDEMIAKPLGLADTAYDDELTIVPRRAKGYGLRSDRLINAEALSVSISGGAGGMRSTASDLLRWHAALFGGKLLKPESLALMLEPTKLKDGRTTSQSRKPGADGRPPLDYGLGIAFGTRDGRRLIGHGGAINGFASSLYTFPDRSTTIVVLANTDNGASDSVWNIADIVLGK